MDVYAIPLYLYIEVNSMQEAQGQVLKVKTLLANPMIKMALAQANIRDRGFIVMDPQKT